MKRNKRTRAGNGCGTLVKRGNVYHARWCVGGRLVSRTTGTGNLAEARAFLARFSVARRGQADRDAVRKLAGVLAANLADTDTSLRLIGVPVAQLFDLYRDAPSRRETALRTTERYRGQLHLLADWIERRHPEITSARDISQTVADEYIADRARTASANSVNKDLNLFAAVWRALSRRYGFTYNPWTPENIARRRNRPTCRRALSDAEVAALLARSTGELHRLVLVGISTGLRLGDIVRLRWADADMDRRELTVATGKTGRVVVLPMTDNLHAELAAARAAQRPGEDAVFPGLRARLRANGGTEHISNAVSRLFRACGIEPQQTDRNGRRAPLATFHSLRHTFVTRLIKRGVSPALVQAAVGHSSMLMTEHYTHIDADTLKRALAPDR